MIPQATHRETQSIAEAKFLLKLREGHHVSQVVLTEVVNGCQTLFKQAIEGLGEKPFKFYIPIGDKISNNKDHWSCFQLLLKICSICCSPVCKFNTVAYLHIVIEE